MFLVSKVLCPKCFKETIYPIKDEVVTLSNGDEIKFPMFECGSCEERFNFPIYIDYLSNLKKDITNFVLVKIRGYNGRVYFEGKEFFKTYKQMLDFVKFIRRFKDEQK